MAEKAHKSGADSPIRFRTPGQLRGLRQWLPAVTCHAEWRLILWSFALVFGTSLYFILPFEPGWRLLCTVTGICGGLVIAARTAVAAKFAAAPYVRGVAASIFPIWTGLLVPAAYAALAAPPTLSDPAYIDGRTAYVLRVDQTAAGDPRYLLKLDIANAERPLGLAPGSVYRLTDRTHRSPDHPKQTGGPGGGQVAAGQTLRLSARLLPNPGPVIPGGYDFARRAFFSGISGVGFLTDVPVILDRGPGGREAVRQTVTLYLQSLLDPDIAGIAAAMMVGKRGLISEPVQEDLRSTGLAHLLAISGLHMGLMAGAAFFLIEIALARWTWFAERHHGRRYAAVGAWCVATGYLLVSGMAVSAVRAYIMISIALLAVLVMRRAISLRSVCLALCVVTVLHPADIVGPGFQMSFAASFALIAVYERVSQTRPTSDGSYGNDYETSNPGNYGGILGPWWGRFLSGISGVVGATMIAQIAIAPIALAHFGSVSVLGAVANIIVMPLMSLILMPLILISFLLMPFGLAAPAVWLLGQGIQLVISVAALCADLPVASITSVPLTGAALSGLVALGVAALVVCLSPPWLTAVPLLGGLVLLPGMMRGPDIVIAAGPNILLQDFGGQGAGTGDRLHAYRLRKGFMHDVWMQAFGYRPSTPKAPIARQCDGEGCIWVMSVTAFERMTALNSGTKPGPVHAGDTRASQSVLLAQSRHDRAVIRDCLEADIVIVSAYRANCQAFQIIDADLRQRGPVVLRRLDTMDRTDAARSHGLAGGLGAEPQADRMSDITGKTEGNSSAWGAPESRPAFKATWSLPAEPFRPWHRGYRPDR